jgi:hypothetical protein
MCLDSAAAVEAVRELAKVNIHTFVIGFGTGTSGSIAASVLNAMAQAGKEPQAGATAYYQANDQAQLQAVLDRIKVIIGGCNFSIEAPAKSGALVVKRSRPTGEVERVLQSGTDYTYDGSTQVKIEGAECELLKAAKPGEWVLEFQYLVDF